MPDADPVRAVRASPLRIEQLEGESAHAALCRLAFRHGFGGTTAFLNSLGLRHGLVEAARAGRRVGEVAGIARHDERAMLHWTIRDVGDGLELAGERIGGRGPAHRWVRYGRACPRCLEHDLRAHDGPTIARAYQRSWWDLASVGHCPRHSVELLERCPRCRASLGTPYADRSRCRCGCDLATVPTSPVDRALLDGERYLLGRLGVCPTTPHPLLDELAFFGASSLMEHLGRMVVGELAGSPARSRAAHLAAGLEALRDWPDRFSAVLDAASGEGLMTKGVNRGRYRTFKCSVERNATSWGPVAAVLQTHAETRVARRRKTSVVGAGPQGGWRTTSSVAKDLGCTRRALAEVARVLGIIEHSSDWARLSKVADGDVERLRGYLDDVVTATEAARVLGLRHREFTKLVEGGCLEPASKSDMRGFPRYRREAVDRLAGRFVASAHGGSGHDLLTVRRAAETFGCSAVALALAILDGTVAVSASVPGLVGIDAALLRQEDVAGHLRGTLGETLTLSEAKGRSKLSYDLLCAAIRAGHLEDCGRPSKYGYDADLNPHRYVTARDLERFCDRFSSTYQLAARFGVKHGTVRSVLGAAGVASVCSVGPQAIYDRRTAEEALERWRDLSDVVRAGTTAGRPNATLIPERDRLTDYEWESLEDLVPSRRRSCLPARTVVERVMLKFGAALRWEDVEVGREVSSAFEAWARLGVWERVCSRLRAVSPSRVVPEIAPRPRRSVRRNTP